MDITVDRDIVKSTNKTPTIKMTLANYKQVITNLYFASKKVQED
jgi:hypothetical protein|tara:strand:+ start:291 stop:422 length:132 start_codon:yes stop_codon:yes gene_type:complete